MQPRSKEHVLPRTNKLERLEIPPECRTVKDWFPTREAAEAVLSGIYAHIRTTGQTHTHPAHTHTKPPKDAVPVYIGEFSLPERFLKAKRFAPCPCCWDEFGKFGHGRVAWFPEERVIRLIGDDCFEALNPEAHRQAKSVYEEEVHRRRNTSFLLSNLGHIPKVLSTIGTAVVAAKALEQFHELLHDRFRMVHLHLTHYIGPDGDLSVWEKEGEFRKDVDNEMYTEDVLATRVYGRLPGYEMVTRKTLHLSNVLDRCAERLNEFYPGPDWEPRIAEWSDSKKQEATEQLSKAVSVAKKVITTIRELRRFTEPVATNTLRGWGLHPGCPAPFLFKHDGASIMFGPSEFRMVGVPLLPELNQRIEDIEFWTPLEPRRR